MGLLDRLTATVRPPADAAPVSADELRTALLAAADGQPWALEAEPDGVLKAHWRVEDPAWLTFFEERQVTRTVEVRLRLVPDRRTVRHQETTRTVTRSAGALRLGGSVEGTRGVLLGGGARRWEWQRGKGLREIGSWSPEQLLGPLRDAVVARGWTWRGVPLRRL